MISNQKALNIEYFYKQSYDKSDFFLAKSNNQAFHALNNTENWFKNILIIVGQKSSGKTHLASIWKSQNNAVELFYDNKVNSFDNYENEKSINHYLIENFDLLKCNKDFELKLFTLINYFIENNNTKLLLTAQQIPHFELEDLNSRISSLTKAKIKQPEKELLNAIFHKEIYSRQIKLKKDIIEYIINKISKFKSIDQILIFCSKIYEYIEKYNKSKISKKDIENIMSEIL